MPCRYDDAPTHVVYQDKQETLDELAKYRAGFCALVNELLLDESVGNVIIDNASNNGKIDIRSIMNDHKEFDKKRVHAQISHMSLHEKRLLKEILEDVRI